MSGELTEEELKAAEYIPLPEEFYVYYRDDGSIFGISNRSTVLNGNYLRISKSIAIDFLSGKKNYFNYRIEHFKNNNFLDKFDDSQPNKEFLYMIPKKDSADLLLIHDVLNKSWKFKASETCKIKLGDINPNFVFEFYITKLRNPHYLYRKMFLTTQDILNDPVIDFDLELENDLEIFSIFGFRTIIENYGIKKCQ